MLAGVVPTTAAAATATNPLIGQDLPDPSVLRTGGDFWMVATSKHWAPAFPVLHSRDLVSWRRVGAVFERPPSWSAGALWAPAITRHGGKVQVFFAARRRGARHCIGMAEAPTPRGPWRDRGLVHCPAGGAIDAAPVVDERGRRWLAYKKMGLHNGIWIRRLRDDGRRTAGRAVELLRPDRPWEEATTEAPDLVRRDGRWWLLYSAGHCCRPPCTYQVGIAVADRLTGPYVRRPKPALGHGSTLKCPGHGGLVEDGTGRLWFVHHAYRTTDTANARRMPVLTAVRWPAGEEPSLGEDGFPVDSLPFPAVTRPAGLRDTFAGARLAPGWERPFARPILERVAGGRLRLRGSRPAALLAHPVELDDWRATARVRERGCAVGLAAVQHGDRLGAVGAEVAGRRVVAWRGARTQRPVAAIETTPARTRTLVLEVRDGRTASVATLLGGRAVPIGHPLQATPGQRFTRVGLTCRGSAGDRAEVLDLRVEPLPPG